MGSPSAVLTLGFGAWGSVGEVITLGYGSGDAAAATFTIEGDVFTDDALTSDSNRLLAFQMTNVNPVVFTFEETEVS